jgi:O-antigen/teichoic acid export membrane protein
MADAGASRSPGAEATPAEPVLTTEDISRRAASGAALLTAKGAFTQVLGLVSMIVVTRLLVPDQVGLFAIAATVAGFLAMLGGGVGLAGALIRHPNAPERADLRAYVALQLTITSALVLLVVAVALPFGPVGALVAIMIAGLPFSAFRGASLIVLERQLLYKRLSTAETAETVAYYGWTIVAVAIGWGVWGLASAILVRSFVGAASIIALSPTGIVWPRFDRKRIRAIVGVGSRVQAAEFVAALRDQILLLGAAAVGSVATVAYWGIVVRALQAPGMLLLSLLRVSFPAMSRTRSAGGDPARLLPRLLPAATVVVGMLLAPLAGGAPALVPFLFGSRWSPAANALSLACLAVVIHMPVVIAGQSYLWTAGDAKAPLRAMIADAVVVVSVAIPLVPILGVLGIAISAVCAALVHTAILARAIDRDTNVRVFNYIRTPVLVWIVATGVAWGCAQAPGSLVFRALISCCVAVTLYAGLLLLGERELTVGLGRECRALIRRRASRRGAAPASLTSGA